MRRICKWKSKFFFFLILSMFVFSTVAYAAETQTLTIDPVTENKAVTEAFALTVNYTVTNDAATAGIAAVVHFNSSKVTFVDFSDVDTDAANGTIFNQIQVPQDDITDLDNDTTTDKYVSLTWTNFANAFSGTSRPLGVVNFTVNESAYNGPAQFNITTGNPAFGLTRETNGATITVTGGKAAPSEPVLSPVAGYYNDAVSVTAEVDDGVTTYYTLDGTEPDATDLEYAGVAINVDDDDTNKVTVTMKSYDPVGDIWGDPGSADYTFDKADPVVVISEPSADAVVETAALIIEGTASDVTSGVAKVEVSIDGQANWADAILNGENWTFNAALAKGENAIAVRVTDEAGNAVVIPGNTMTYTPPPLVLTVDGVDVTGQKIRVPNTAGSNTRTITVSGGSEDFANYNWTTGPDDPTFGALSASTGESVTYTAVVGQKGTHTVTVTDPADATTANMTIEVFDFSVSADKDVGYVGTPVVFTAVGNSGTFEWEVVGDGADVAGIPVISGNDDAIATITPVAAGTFQLKATDGGAGGTGAEFTTPAFTIYAVPDFSGLPETTETYNPTNPSEYTVSGGDETYEWTVTNPANEALDPVTGASFTFKAPTTGNFAGNYTVKVAESTAYESSFNVYVPLTITPEQTDFVVLGNADALPFTISGAEDGKGYTVTIDSLDDQVPDDVDTGNVANNVVNFEFNPADANATVETRSKDYAINAVVDDYKASDIPEIHVTVVPVADYSGKVTDSAGLALDDVKVTITGPANSAGETAMSDGNAEGAFTFKSLPAVDPQDDSDVDYTVMAEKAGYVTETDVSLNADGSTVIEMKNATASLSGTVLYPDGSKAEDCNVVLINANGNTIDTVSTENDGVFSFEFETVPATPVTYTVKATKQGYEKEVTITVPKNGFDYTVTPDITLEKVTPAEKVLGEVAPETGGKVEMDFGTNDIPDEVKDEFGLNAGTITITIAKGTASGGPLSVFPPDITDPASLQGADKPDEAITWRIDNIGHNTCVIIPVPFEAEDTADVKDGLLNVIYANSNSPSDWKQANINSVDYDKNIIYAEICEWSSNYVGLGNVSDNSGSVGDGGQCFINSVSSGDNFAGIATLAVLFACAAALAAVRRKKNQ
ncbi:carboxypeptidase regulatory-like domain-containing protein [Desulfobacter latus]|uniref:Carboxypeptidase regulatory-like domain-containing protein n=1 Tax=Desulfobacter latus TaxID=2292 RepID=A0A850TAM8_9BACT|nr:carboxypeptidase regulatory-like domain-containing protein [Desulfobacter latus]NWH05648.1 carboxypeptidase regulatory-like domain-containing protein [Desulfobacter latus]